MVGGFDDMAVPRMRTTAMTMTAAGRCWSQSRAGGAEPVERVQRTGRVRRKWEAWVGFGSPGWDGLGRREESQQSALQQLGMTAFAFADHVWRRARATMHGHEHESRCMYLQYGVWHGLSRLNRPLAA